MGGKALTNQFKEWVSFRKLDVREETYVMNKCKEDVCFVSTDFEKDLQTARYVYICSVSPCLDFHPPRTRWPWTTCCPTS